MKKIIIVNKSLSKEVTWLGLKAKYIYMYIYVLFISLVFTLFMGDYLGTSVFIIAGLMVFIGFTILTFYSKTFGENGFKKKSAAKSQPQIIRVNHSIKKILCHNENTL